MKVCGMRRGVCEECQGERLMGLERSCSPEYVEDDHNHEEDLGCGYEA